MKRLILILLVSLSIAFALSLFAGRVWLDLAETPNAMVILAELRLPRALLAITVGAGLGAAGAGCQPRHQGGDQEPPALARSHSLSCA